MPLISLISSPILIPSIPSSLPQTKISLRWLNTPPPPFSPPTMELRYLCQLLRLHCTAFYTVLALSPPEHSRHREPHRTTDVARAVGNSYAPSCRQGEHRTPHAFLSLFAPSPLATAPPFARTLRSCARSHYCANMACHVDMPRVHHLAPPRPHVMPMCHSPVIPRAWSTVDLAQIPWTLDLGPHVSDSFSFFLTKIIPAKNGIPSPTSC